MKTTINVRIDSELKNDAEKIISELGLSISSAITLFFKAVVRTESLPFEVKIKDAKKDAEAKNPGFKTTVSKPSQKTTPIRKPKQKRTKESSESIRRAIQKL